jgi:hypothetical protein
VRGPDLVELPREAARSLRARFASMVAFMCSACARQVEVNETAQNGATALMVASQQGQVEVVRLLLAHPDVKANRTSSDGRSALCVVSQSGHGAIVSLLGA